MAIAFDRRGQRVEECAFVATRSVRVSQAICLNMRMRLQCVCSAVVRVLSLHVCECVLLILVHVLMSGQGIRGKPK